jgi:hypothetical protein
MLLFTFFRWGYWKSAHGLTFRFYWTAQGKCVGSGDRHLDLNSGSRSLAVWPQAQWPSNFPQTPATVISFYSTTLSVHANPCAYCNEIKEIILIPNHGQCIVICSIPLYSHPLLFPIHSFKIVLVIAFRINFLPHKLDANFRLKIQS